jgi:hypothetical protein
MFHTFVLASVRMLLISVPEMAFYLCLYLGLMSHWFQFQCCPRLQSQFLRQPLSR